MIENIISLAPANIRQSRETTDDRVALVVLVAASEMRINYQAIPHNPGCRER